MAPASMVTADQGKEGLPPGQSPNRQLARRLIEAPRSERSDADSLARATAAACARLYRELSRWVGLDGCYALFSRALAEARTDHPALAQIEIRARTQPHIDAVAETIMARGDPATAEALEFMLERLIELLGRLIGDDMAIKLIERSLAAPAPGSNDRREEA
jgi:hypothetical protein